ncbi:hypothetical protein D3C73_1199320 [compost metagenome]
MALAVGDGDFVQAMALWAAQQAIKNLAADQRREHGDVLGCIQQAGQAQHGVEHRCVDPLDIQAAPGGAGGYAQGPGVGDERGDLGGVDVQANSQDRLL